MSHVTFYLRVASITIGVCAQAPSQEKHPTIWHNDNDLLSEYGGPTAFDRQRRGRIKDDEVNGHHMSDEICI